MAGMYKRDRGGFGPPKDRDDRYRRVRPELDPVPSQFSERWAFPPARATCPSSRARAVRPPSSDPTTRLTIVHRLHPPRATTGRRSRRSRRGRSPGDGTAAEEARQETGTGRPRLGRPRRARRPDTAPPLHDVRLAPERETVVVDLPTGNQARACTCPWAAPTISSTNRPTTSTTISTRRARLRRRRRSRRVRLR